MARLLGRRPDPPTQLTGRVRRVEQGCAFEHAKGVRVAQPRRLQVLHTPEQPVGQERPHALRNNAFVTERCLIP